MKNAFLRVIAIFLVLSESLNPATAILFRRGHATGIPSNLVKEAMADESITIHPEILENRPGAAVFEMMSKQLTRREGFVALLAASDDAQPPQKSVGLTEEQRRLFRLRVDFFANRYRRGMSDQERQQIVDETTVTNPAKINWLKSLPLLSAVVVNLGVVWYLWKTAVKAKTAHPSMSRRKLILSFINGTFAIGLLWVVFHPQVLSNKRIAGSTENGRISLDEEYLRKAGAGEGFLSLIDHELVHIFGSEKFKIIDRDSFLAPAYVAVLSVARGGEKALTKGLFQILDDDLRDVDFFNLGASFSSRGMDPEVVDQLEQKLSSGLSGRPINPDADSDASAHNPSVASNLVYVLFLGGTAWITAQGNLDGALLYLDLRGNGATPTAATNQVKEWLLRNNWVPPADFAHDILNPEKKKSPPKPKEKSLRDYLWPFGLLLGGLVVMKSVRNELTVSA